MHNHSRKKSEKKVERSPHEQINIDREMIIGILGRLLAKSWLQDNLTNSSDMLPTQPLKDQKADQ